MQYKRILLKLSGEALMGKRQYGIDPDRLKEYAEDIKQLTEKELEIAIVIGGGNIFRGLAGASKGMDRVQGDHMGMLATVINGLALQGALEDEGIPTRLQSAVKINEVAEPVAERIKDVERKIEKEKNGWIKRKLQERLSMLTGKVGVIYIGADSEVELKEKKERVDDALHATKAALAEGIVPGGGVALLNASQTIVKQDEGYDILLSAITAPYHTILKNAGFDDALNPKEYVESNKDINDRDWAGVGIDATCGCYKNMIDSGIIDPVLVTKAALKNAISVATTIVSADCIISNVRTLESN